MHLLCCLCLFISLVNIDLIGSHIADVKIKVVLYAFQEPHKTFLYGTPAGLSVPNNTTTLLIIYHLSPLSSNTRPLHPFYASYNRQIL